MSVTGVAVVGIVLGRYVGRYDGVDSLTLGLHVEGCDVDGDDVLGAELGPTDGHVVGIGVGPDDGSAVVGASEGLVLGTSVGKKLGTHVGTTVGR